MEDLNTEGRSDRSIRSQHQSSLRGILSDRSNRNKENPTGISDSISAATTDILQSQSTEQLNPSSIGNIPSDRSTPGAPDEILAANTVSGKGPVKPSGLSVSGKDKKSDKSTVNCLNLVSKACFRKIPPSSFYLFFGPKTEKQEYTQSGVSIARDVSKAVQPQEGTQKGILLEKDFELYKEQSQPKTVKVVGFGIGDDIHKVKDEENVKSDSTLGESPKSLSSPETQTKTEIKKEITKSKKRVTGQNLQGTSQAASEKKDETRNKKKTKLAAKNKSQASTGMASTATGNEEVEEADKNMIKKGSKGVKKAKKPKKGTVAMEDTTSVLSEEAVPSSGKTEIEQVEDLGAEVEEDEQGFELKQPENVTPMRGSLDMLDIQDGLGDITQLAESSDLKVWKSGMLVGQDQLESPSSPSIEPAPVVIPSSVRKSGTPDSADSSSSSNSSGSDKSRKLSSPDASKTEITQEVPEDTNQSPAMLQRVAQNQMQSVASDHGLCTSHSFAFGTSFAFDPPTGSFMVQSQSPMMSSPSPNLSTTYTTLEEPPDVLKAVSSCTMQLLNTYNALIEDKNGDQWAPIKDLMSVMSYDELTQKREPDLEDFEPEVREETEENEEEHVLTCPEEVREDSSAQLLGSNITPSSETSVLGSKHKLLPDNFSNEDFMKYFCSDWDYPPYGASTKPSLKDTFTAKEEKPKTVAEAIDMIDPTAKYDVIFTYKLPKSAPFDLNDSLADVRYKCVRNWMNDTVNASYRTYFDSEIKGKAEEKLIKQLMERMVALQLKIRECEDMKRNKPICSLPTESSESSFTADDTVGDKAEGLEEEADGESEDWSEYPSDAQIESEIGILMTKLEQLRPEDSEVKEKRVVESVDTSAAEHADKSSQSCQSIGSGSGSGSRRVMTESRGKRRRKEVKEQLEKVIGLLEKKLNCLKNETNRISRFQCYDQENEEANETPLPAKRSDSHQQLDLQIQLDDDTFVQDIESKLKRDFLIGQQPKTNKSKSNVKDSHESHKKSPNNEEVLTQRQRLQLYLLGLSDTWKKEEEDDSPPEFDVQDKRLLDTLKKEDLLAGIRHIRHQKKHIKHLPKQQEKGKMKSGGDDEESNRKSQASGSNKVKTGPGSSKHAKNRNAQDIDLPFTCNCLCDRVSRFNAKRKDHFRTVLSENLWCLRSNSQLVARNEHTQSKKPPQETAAGTLCPPEDMEEPDNFRGWLADTDRNLLLLFNRPPLDRLDKDYYKQPEMEKHQPSPELKKEDSKTVLKHRMEEVMKKLSKQEAEKFWVQVEQWYSNYRKCDKTWQLIEEFETIDINAMMERDLSALKEEMDEKLKADKMKVKLHLELIYRKKFFENLKKLRDEYECSVRNRVAAKEKEMEARKEFVVQSTLRDMKDNFGPIKQEHKKRCIEWMGQIRDRTNATSQTVKQRQARELALMVDKMDVAERTRRKLIAATGKEHEEMEETLGKAVKERAVLIEELDRKADNLTRDGNIWKRAVREVLNSFKKFMHYILETRPDRAQYFLSLEKLYQIQMDDMIREASEELKKVKTSEAELPREEEILQPTMEIKCPSHDIRYPSELSTRTGSSSDTDIEKDTRDAKVAGHVVDEAIRAVLPTPDVSEGGEDEERARELEELISRFVTQDSERKIVEPDIAEAICEEETTEKSERGPLLKETSDPEVSVEEFTRRRIRDMLQIISRRKPQIKGHIHL